MVGSATLTLDTIVNSALFFSAKWKPELKRSQSRDVLRVIINKLYGSSRGAIFHAQARSSHAAIADSLNLSREWTCKLIGRIREAGWITTEARRLPNGTQEISIFRPGRMLKRLFVMLLRSRQRQHASRVNTTSQYIPTREDVAKNKAFLADLRATLMKQLTLPDPRRTFLP